MAIEVSDQSFEDEVIKSSLPVLVDFWAPWCGPCRMVAPVIEKLSDKYKGKFKFVKLNVDENPKTAGAYKVMSIPTLLLFKNGKVDSPETASTSAAGRLP
jgi:thioredoxin 1